MKDKKNYCTLYIVRHGETDWNLKKLIQGQSDIPLNKRGKLQAEALAKELKKINFSAYFSSDLLRARRTAEIVALERKIAVNTTKLLRERSYGQLEGKPRTLLRIRKELIKDLSKEQIYSFKLNPDMESDREMVERFITFVREVAVAYANKTILAVTHGGLMRAFLVKIGFFPPLPSDSFIGWIGNSAYVKLKTDGVDFLVEETKGIKKKE